MKICEFCELPNSDNAEACRYCGRSLLEVPIVPDDPEVNLNTKLRRGFQPLFFLIPVVMFVLGVIIGNPIVLVAAVAAFIGVAIAAFIVNAIADKKNRTYPNKYVTKAVRRSHLMLWWMILPTLIMSVAFVLDGTAVMYYFIKDENTVLTILYGIIMAAAALYAVVIIISFFMRRKQDKVNLKLRRGFRPLFMLIPIVMFLAGTVIGNIAILLLGIVLFMLLCGIAIKVNTSADKFNKSKYEKKDWKNIRRSHLLMLLMAVPAVVMAAAFILDSTGLLYETALETNTILIILYGMIFGSAALFVAILIFAAILVEKGKSGELKKSDRVYSEADAGADDFNVGKTGLYSELCAVDKNMQFELVNNFAADTSLSVICDEFRSLCASEHIRLGEEQIKSLFSAMAATRLVFVGGKNEDCTKKVLALLAKFFNVKLHIDGTLQSWSDDSTVSYFNNGGTLAEPPSFIDVYSAGYTTENICPVVFDGADLTKLSTQLKKYIEYVKNPIGDVDIPIIYDNDTLRPGHSDNGLISMSSNIWFFVTVSDQQIKKGLPKNLQDISYTIRLDASYDENVNGTFRSRGVLSELKFEILMQDSRDNTYIPDDIWSNADKFEEGLIDNCGCELGNKNVRLIEKYAAAYASCGGNSNEAFDSAFSKKLLNILGDRINVQLADGETWGALLRKSFGEENIPETLEVLRNAAVSAE